MEESEDGRGPEHDFSQQHHGTDARIHVYSILHREWPETVQEGDNVPREAESRRRWARRRGYAVLRATGIVGILALATWAPAAGQEGAEARVTVDRLNFREECGMSSSVLGVLTRDETVTVLGSELGTWVRVRNADGEEGCVSAQYLEVAPTPAEADSMATPNEDPSPYAWADLTDSDSAEIVEEIEQLDREIASTSDPEEQEELRQEIDELNEELRIRQEELAEEREEAVRETEIAARQETQGDQVMQAQSPTRRAPADSDWTGFYVGVNAGYGFGDEADVVLVFQDGSSRRSEEADVDGVDGGVQLGYNHQFGRFVLGGEADFQSSGQSGSVDLASIGFPGSGFEFEYDTYGTIRARVGFAIGRVLLYGTGGYAYADAEDQFTGPLADVLPPRSVSLSGFAVGAGAEFNLAGQLSLKGEFLSLEFDDEPDFEGSEFFIARVGLNWGF